MSVIEDKLIGRGLLPYGLLAAFRAMAEFYSLPFLGVIHSMGIRLTNKGCAK